MRNTYQEYVPFSDANINDKEQIYNNADSHHKHIYTRYNQRDAYRSSWQNLQPYQVLVAHDFGTLTCDANAAEREHYVTRLLCTIEMERIG